VAWIERRNDGAGVTYWIRDRRNGLQIIIPAGRSYRNAKRRLEEYKTKRDSKGKFSDHEQVAETLFGKRR